MKKFRELVRKIIKESMDTEEEDTSSEEESEDSDEGDVLFPVPSESSNNMLFPEKV